MQRSNCSEHQLFVVRCAAQLLRLGYTAVDCSVVWSVLKKGNASFLTQCCWIAWCALFMSCCVPLYRVHAVSTEKTELLSAHRCTVPANHLMRTAGGQCQLHQIVTCPEVESVDAECLSLSSQLLLVLLELCLQITQGSVSHSI